MPYQLTRLLALATAGALLAANATLLAPNAWAQSEEEPNTDAPSEEAEAKPAKTPPVKPKAKPSAEAKETPAADTPTEPPRSEWGVDGPYVLDLHVRFGGGWRLDEPPLYEVVAPGGVLAGAGLGLALSPRIAIGLTYEYLDLGTERSNVLESGVVNVARELHNGWLDLKLYPIKANGIGAYVSVAAGLSVQGADLSASLWLPEDPGNNVSFFCGGTGDPGFAVQGSLGVDMVIAPGARFLLDGSFANHRLSDDIIGSCAPGAGTATVVAIRSGLGYAWDL